MLKYKKFGQAALVISVLYSAASVADVEQDKNAGLCIAYFTLTESPKGRLAAIKMADKPDRANQFAQNEINRLMRANKEGRLEKVWDDAILSGASSCRKAGIRPSDYK